MANGVTHYRELAARAQAEADGSMLDNVRDRALRSAAAFEAMAVQHERTFKQRMEREAAAELRAAGEAEAEAVAQENHRD